MRNPILFLTDRQTESLRVRRDLSLLRPCVLAPVHMPPADLTPAAIVSDVALDKTVQVRLLRTALARHAGAGVPYLCLLRETTHHAVTQARALGATRTLPADPGREALLSEMTELLGMESLAHACTAKAGVVLADLLEAAERGGPIAPHAVTEGANLVLRAIGEADIRNWLETVWQYDDITYQHCLLVAGLAAALAVKLRFRQADCRRLTEAALIHDVGKARIPLAILMKPGRLTDDELAVMRTHAAIGYDLLLRQGGFSPELLAAVRSHHEVLDGSGYPDGLTADRLPDLVRMVTICDIYAALVEHRPYKKPLAPDQAFALMKGMTGKLDDDLLAAFEEVAAACMRGETPTVA